MRKKHFTSRNSKEGKGFGGSDRHYKSSVMTFNEFANHLVDEILKLPNAEQIFQELGSSSRKQRMEFNFGAKIIKNLFSDYTIIEQMPVLGGQYKIDWYIPELKLAIEFDEADHIYKKGKDLRRQQVIEAELGCHFVRYKQDFHPLRAKESSVTKDIESEEDLKSKQEKNGYQVRDWPEVPRAPLTGILRSFCENVPRKAAGNR